MSPSAFRRRLCRLEQASPTNQTRVTNWVLLCGDFSPENISREDIAVWEPIFEAAARAVDQCDVIEELIRRHSATDD